MTPEEAREMAEAYWRWVETWLHIVYVDAFVHGAKHATDAAAVQPGKASQP